MERLVGRDLRALLREQSRLEPTRAVSLAVAACSGLAAAHSAHVVHRDLKPENLFVLGSDGDERVKILDFGVAKLRRASNSAEEGTLVGTLRYMAPEQVRSGGDCDQRTGVYSLAAILYECLTGRPPFRDRNPHRLLYRILHEKPVPPHVELASIPLELSELLLNALEKDPRNRPFDAPTLARALSPFGGFMPGASNVVVPFGDSPEFASRLGSTFDGATTEPTVSTAPPRMHGWARWSMELRTMTATFALMAMVADSVSESVAETPVARPSLTPLTATSSALSPERNHDLESFRPLPDPPAPRPTNARERTKVVAASRKTTPSSVPTAPSSAVEYGVFAAPLYESTNPYR